MDGDPSKRRRGLWGRALGAGSVVMGAVSSVLRRVLRPHGTASRQAQLLLVGVVIVGLVTVLGSLALWTAFLGWPEALSGRGRERSGSRLGVVRDIVASSDLVLPGLSARLPATPRGVRGDDSVSGRGRREGELTQRDQASTTPPAIARAASRGRRRSLLPLDTSLPEPRIAFAVPVGGKKDRSGPLLRLLKQLG